MESSAVGDELLERLRCSDTAGLYGCFADYLSDLIETAQQSEKPKRKKQAAAAEGNSSLRSLAKKYIQFISRALQILPSLRQNPNNPQDLRRIYALILDCLARISPCVDSKPFFVHLYRCEFVCTLVAWGMHAEAEDEALALLGSLRDTIAPSRKPARRGKAAAKDDSLQHLPDLVKDADAEVALLIVRVTISLAGCLHRSSSKEPAAYERLLVLVGELHPWISLLDAEASKKCQTLLVNNLCKCSLYLAQEAMSFDFDLVWRFCYTTLMECLHSPSTAQFAIIARKICSSTPAEWETRTLLTRDIFETALESIMCGCKGGVVGSTNELLVFLSYSADVFLNASVDISSYASDILHRTSLLFLQVAPPVASILVLYAAGLYFSTVVTTTENHHILQSLSGSLCVLTGVFQPEGSSDKLSQDHESTKPGCCRLSHGAVSFISYLDALEFLCNLLVKWTDTAWMNLLSQKVRNHIANKSCIEEILERVSKAVLAALRTAKMSESFKDRMHNCRRSFLQSILAAFRVSVGFSWKSQLSAFKESIDCAITSDLIDFQELKFLISKLYNMGVQMFDVGWREQASQAFRLCCETVVSYASHRCCTVLDEPGSQLKHALFEDKIDALTYSYMEIAKMINALHKCGAEDIDGILANSLSTLSVIEENFQYVNGSFDLIQQWVKINSRKVKALQSADSAPILYHLIRFSACSKEIIGRILEQEVSSYELVKFQNPPLYSEIQLKVIDILLCDLYSNKCFSWRRSKVLIRKAITLRACGVEGLISCLECLSEAILLLKEFRTNPSVDRTTVSHQLALAHCLHAQYAHDANQNFQVILDELQCALHLWSTMDNPTKWPMDTCWDLAAENIIKVLCYLADLMSVKGAFQFQAHLSKLICMFCKSQNIPLEKCLAMLWNDKRLSHSFCTSTIDESFIIHISEHYSSHATTFQFWISCLKGLPSSHICFIQKLLSHFMSIDESLSNCGVSSFTNFTVNEVEKAASSLVADEHMPLQSAFMAGTLYHELSERLLLSGRLFENGLGNMDKKSDAISQYSHGNRLLVVGSKVLLVGKAIDYAKVALQLHETILRRKFPCFFSSKSSNVREAGNAAGRASHVTLFTEDVEKGHFLTPWNICRSYLESTLQVALLHEYSGNGAEAESLLTIGKHISSLNGLWLFEIAFRSALGHLYLKKQLWNLAEAELRHAKELLDENDNVLSCQQCKLTFKVTIEMEMGDLSRKNFGNELHVDHAGRLSHARDLYTSALVKLDDLDIKGLHIFCVKPETQVSTNRKAHFDKGKVVGLKNCSSPLSALRFRWSTCASSVDVEKQLEDMGFPDDIEGGEYRLSEAEKKPMCQSKCMSKKLNAYAPAKTRRTASTEKSRVESTKDIFSNNTNSIDAPVKCRRTHSIRESCYSKSMEDAYGNSYAAESTLKQNGKRFGDFACDKTCIFKETRCRRCFLIKSLEGGSVNDIIYLKREFYHKRVSMQLLLKIARCLGARESFCLHEVHNVLRQCIFLFFNTKPLDETAFPTSRFINLITEENVGDMFCFERVLILYHLAWFTLKNLLTDNSRSACCSLSNATMFDAVFWLLKAFILARELPLLFSKVSKLLATAMMLSTLGDFGPLPFGTVKPLSFCHWASYFHQASIGSSLHQQFVSCGRDNGYDHKVLFAMGKQINCVGPTLLRLAPVKLEQLEESVVKFFESLPNIPVICISILDRNYVNLLEETQLLSYPAWMLFSRLNQNGQPIVMLLPLVCISEEVLPEDANLSRRITDLNMVSLKSWECPWGDAVVNYLVASYKQILEENFSSLSSMNSDAVQMDSKSWWSWRYELNNRLNELLRSMEESWLGPWRCLLLGECSENRHLDTAVRKLTSALSSQCEIEPNENLLRAILGGAKDAADAKACISQLLLYKGYIGRGSCCEDERVMNFTNSKHGESILQLTHQVIEDEINGFTGSIERDPIILVLDSDIQMLPWESLPVLRRQEAYRMPSISSIFSMVNRKSNKQVEVFDAAFPLIDLLNTYYLLNPSGDFAITQVEFEHWFRTQNWEGKAGSAPTAEELIIALQNHDLFLYFDHGSGMKYIPARKIQKLDKCAATLLMGCSSGSLTLKGCYAPQGAPISYLVGGSPAVIANLWDVSDRDIDRFGKAILNSWLQQQHADLSSSHDQLIRDFGSVNIDDDKNTVKSRNRKKSSRSSKKSLDLGNDRPRKSYGSRGYRIASSISEAREACKLSFLIGASPVCYGVPTMMKRR